jgi:hypothetical protein
VYNYYGFLCGSQPESNQPQLQAAAPFAITGGGAALTQINADWVDTGGSNSGGQVVTYTIWQRTGLNAPGAEVSSGTLGLYSTPGINDPGITADPTSNYALHEYTGLNVPLPAGNYYLSIAASGAGYDGVDCELDWLAGATQPANLEWNGIWRSYSYPSPGFFAESPSSIAYSPAISGDPLYPYNLSFALYGTPTPEPSTIALLAAGAVGLAGCVWQYRIRTRLLRHRRQHRLDRIRSAILRFQHPAKREPRS